MAVWKEIIGYEGLYQISNEGQIISQSFHRSNKQKIMKQSISVTTGYSRIALSKNGISKSILVHRLVANAFLQNKTNKKQVNHKDGNKQNNNVNNLEWCSQSENMKHAYKIGLMKPNLSRIRANCMKYVESKKIKVVVSNGETGESKIYESIRLAARSMKVDYKSVYVALKNSKRIKKRYCVGYATQEGIK